MSAITPDMFNGPVTGWSAAINNTSFYICPVCHACIMESRWDDWHRQRHAAWHATLASDEADEAET